MSKIDKSGVPVDDSYAKEAILAATRSTVVRSTPVTDAFAALARPKRLAMLATPLLFLYTLPWLSTQGYERVRPFPIISTIGNDFPTLLTGTVIPYILIALGLNVVVGQAGLLDLGYVGFYATGAYTMGVLTSMHAHWDGILWLAATFLSVAVAMGFGVLLGGPTLRLRGDYLAIVTLGFGEIIRIVAKNTAWLGDARGISDIKSMPSFLWFEISVLEPRWLWTIGLTVVFAVVFLLSLLEHSRVGRAWTAIREDEDAAELMGVPTFTFKLWAFAIGAAVGGLGGVFFTTRNNAIYDFNFDIQKSILFIAAVVLGGLGNRYGAILGAFLVVWLPEKMRDVAPGYLKDHFKFWEEFDKMRYLMFGLVLMFMMIFRPQGLLPRRVKARRERGDDGAVSENSAGVLAASDRHLNLGIASLFVPFLGGLTAYKAWALKRKLAKADEPEPGNNKIARFAGVLGLLLSVGLAWMLLRPMFDAEEEVFIDDTEVVDTTIAADALVTPETTLVATAPDAADTSAAGA